MKHISKFFIFFSVLILINFPCQSDISGQLETIEMPVPGRNEVVLVPFFSASASYINGGLTFMYPIGLFSSTPTVRIGIELGGIGYLPSRTISAQITANSASSTTIRVNLGAVALITEAATGDVIVHLFANET